MKLYSGKRIDIFLVKKGRSEPFHWKVVESPHIESLADMRFDANNTYNSTNYFIAHFIQFFWLWFIIGLEIKKEKLGSSKWVRYEDTHYAVIDEALSKQKI